MKKRLTFYSIFALLIVTVVLLIYLDLTPGVSRGNYRRINGEMRRGDIESLLGAPWIEPNWRQKTWTGGTQEWWHGSQGTIMLVFDEHDRLVWKEWDDSRRRETLFQWILNGFVRVRE